MKNTLTVSTECFDFAMEYLIAEYGLYSHAVDQFFKLGKSDEAIQYACTLGYDIED